MSQTNNKTENQNMNLPFKSGPAIIHEVITIPPLETVASLSLNQEQSKAVVTLQQRKPLYVVLKPLESSVDQHSFLPPNNLLLGSGKNIIAFPQRRYSICSVKPSAPVSGLVQDLKRNSVLLTPIPVNVPLEGHKVPATSSCNNIPITVTSCACKFYTYRI